MTFTMVVFADYIIAFGGVVTGITAFVATIFLLAVVAETFSMELGKLFDSRKRRRRRRRR